MKIRHRLARAATFGALLLSLGGGVCAAELKENSADIQQKIEMPTMAITIKNTKNPGETGCNLALGEKWDPMLGGCAITEPITETGRVVSVKATPTSITADNTAISTLVATLQFKDGTPAGPGVPTTWTTTSGTLSSLKSSTNAAGLTSVTLRGAVAGEATVTATAAKGGANTKVTLIAPVAPILGTRVISLVPTPPSVPANGTPVTLVATVRDSKGQVPGAGVVVYWSSTLNTLSTTQSRTDNAGLATATISGATVGVATVYATTTDLSNAANSGVGFDGLEEPSYSDKYRVRCVTPHDSSNIDCSFIWGVEPVRYLGFGTEDGRYGQPELWDLSVFDGRRFFKDTKTGYTYTIGNIETKAWTWDWSEYEWFFKIKRHAPITSTSVTFTANVPTTETRFDKRNRVNVNSSMQTVAYLYSWDLIWDGVVVCGGGTIVEGFGTPPLDCTRGGYTYKQGKMKESLQNGEYDWDDAYQIIRTSP